MHADHQTCGPQLLPQLGKLNEASSCILRNFFCRSYFKKKLCTLPYIQNKYPIYSTFIFLLTWRHLKWHHHSSELLLLSWRHPSTFFLFFLFFSIFNFFWHNNLYFLHHGSISVGTILLGFFLVENQ